MTRGSIAPALLERLSPRRESAASLIPHEPTPKQQEFLSLSCFESLYGGAAGGGKSDALLMAALQYVHVKDYAALLLRRTYKDLALPGAIMDRAQSWLIPRGVHWDDREKRFTFASGATLSFGYLDTDRDKYRYQSAEFQFIGWDELTQFPEEWYRYLLSRLRRAEGSTVPLRARAATNPGGIGHEWVRRRFVDGDGSRPFIPAVLEDNPHIDAKAYDEGLSNLSPTTYEQLRKGRWVRDSGGLVYAYFDEERNVVARAPALDHHILGIDYGHVDPCAFVVLGWRAHDPAVYVRRVIKRPKLIPSDAAEIVRELDAEFHFVRMVGDVGGLGKGYAEEARSRFHLPIEPAEKHNKLGFIDLLNGDLARGRVLVVRGECEELIKEWQELPWTEDRQKESSGFDNHASDACLYGWRACVAYTEQPEEPRPELGTPEYHDARARELEELAETEHERRASSEWWEH